MSVLARKTPLLSGWARLSALVVLLAIIGALTQAALAAGTFSVRLTPSNEECSPLSGETFVVSGDGVAPNSTVTYTITVDGTGTEIANTTVVADGNGNFSVGGITYAGPVGSGERVSFTTTASGVDSTGAPASASSPTSIVGCSTSPQPDDGDTGNGGDGDTDTGTNQPDNGGGTTPPSDGGGTTTPPSTGGGNTGTTPPASTGTSSKTSSSNSKSTDATATSGSEDAVKFGPPGKDDGLSPLIPAGGIGFLLSVLLGFAAWRTRSEA